MASTLMHAPTKSFLFQWMPSPVGALQLVGSDAGLAAVLWENDRPLRVRLGTLEERSHPVLEEAGRQLAEYFAGHRRTFALALDPIGTEFQRSVWRALASIRYGETRTYGWVAAQTGKPAAIRATGTAIGRNPISIITPCHRVIGQDGTLTGFAGGLPAKRFLLDLERTGC